MCKIEDCKNQKKVRGLCSKHYQQWLKTAKAEDKRPKGLSGSGTVRQDGYIQIREKHPVASKSGYVFLHRKILYDKIGSGSHPCFYCGIIITWMVDLECDHRDHNKSNNKSDNLVPCCFECNRTRFNREKTECPNGHGPYDKAYANGWRYCSKCKNEKEKRRHIRMKQKIEEE